MEGRLKSGERLPSKRALAEHLGISVITVENAYEQLSSEGYVKSQERSGYFVSKVENLPPMSESKGINEKEKTQESEVKWRYDFATNRTSEKYFPFSVWSRLMRETLSYGGEELLRRSPFNGEETLRKAIADYLLRSRGIHAGAFCGKLHPAPLYNAD